LHRLAFGNPQGEKKKKKGGKKRKTLARIVIAIGATRISRAAENIGEGGGGKKKKRRRDKSGVREGKKRVHSRRAALSLSPRDRSSAESQGKGGEKKEGDTRGKKYVQVIPLLAF